MSENYYDLRNTIVEFLNANRISAYDLVRVGRDLCCCRTCNFFVQHYSKDGKPVDFGHFVKNNTIKSVKPNTQSCGFWMLDDGSDTE